LNICDQPIDHMQKEYVKYLFFLYESEKDGFDLGPWPSFEQFIEIYEEEQTSY
jgi:hypothetical protein